MKKKISHETDLLIDLIDETIELKTMMIKLHRKIHSKYYEVLRKYNYNSNGLLVKENRGKRLLHPTQLEKNEFNNNGIVTFD